MQMILECQPIVCQIKIRRFGQGLNGVFAFDRIGDGDDDLSRQFADGFRNQVVAFHEPFDGGLSGTVEIACFFRDFPLRVKRQNIAGFVVQQMQMTAHGRQKTVRF